MTDLLALLLGQFFEHTEENKANELNAALQARAVLVDGSVSTGAGAPEEAGNSPSPAPLLAEEYAALRRVASELYGEARAVGSRTAAASEAGTFSLPFRQTDEEGSGVLPNQRLIIKEAEPGAALDPSGLDRLFERDARRYDSGFTLY